MKCTAISHDKCTGCSACMNICNHGAISMQEDEEGFLYPIINDSLCIDCTLCYKVCPVKVGHETDKVSRILNSYYGYNINQNDLRSSSSGGIFSALADSIISSGGIVYGAAFDYNSCKLKHYSSSEVCLSDIKKSKYVQSEIGYCFTSVKENIKNNRKVLFVGTPCQCAGLVHFLGNLRFNDNLLICDFICHGVPSPRLFLKHLDYLGLKNDEIINIDFRPKLTSWVDYFIIKGKKKTYKNLWSLDPYYWLFENGIIQRECCYSCIYSKGLHESDLTLGDFWGYNKLSRGIYNKDGLSMVIAYTEKGRKYIDSLPSSSCHISGMDPKYCEYAFKNTSNSIDRRRSFYQTLLQIGYKKTVRSYGFSRTGSFLKLVYYEMIKRIIKYKNDILHN